ncbi:hypothetical protein J7T55_015486 [Diaporthe amygdali]|uniref:uncharacterized protein n=1 Tax=Phomopsis amygdali TaxID=1214568 RepID=UPI0022FE3502|nr:uncharacterized protein J7T55_015486 [Diaporthe amygdali]KAJ0120754.1 hypothetical protein J7T55_015486 [Diaporthe amygdali]
MSVTLTPAAPHGTTLPHKRSIRLLTLHAGGSLPLSSPVECELRVVTLPDVDSSISWPYYALSYAWQEPQTLQKAPPGKIGILCNNIQIAVPKNLFIALVRLRQKFQEPVAIWIDYLCIDQSSTSERTQQVALMQEIFSLASEVLIWLGEPSSTGLQEGGKFQVYYHWGEDNEVELVTAYRDSFSEYLRGGNIFKFLDLGHAYGIFCLINLLSRRVPASQIPFHESSVDSPEFRQWVDGLWTAVWEMIDRAWWKRTWVVQECVYASKATVHYGHLSASWEMFSDAARFFMESRLGHDLAQVRRFNVSGSTGDPLPELCGLILQIESPRRALSQGKYLSPLQTLVRFRSRHATDRRDKVFAFLGLLKDHFLTPNYDKATHQVYSEVAKRIIKSTESLELLTSAKPNTSEDMGTWVPDWSTTPGKHEWQRLELLQLYNASKGMAPVAGMHHTSMPTPLLLVSGIWVDRVMEVFQSSSAPEDGYSRFQTTVSHWELQARKSFKILHKASLGEHHLSEDESIMSYTDWIEGGYSDAFWRLLCGDMMYALGASSEGTYRRAQPEDEQLFKAFTEGVVGLNRRMSRMTVKGKRTFYPVRPEASNRTRNQFFYAMQMMTAGRTLFVTDQRRLGVGPKDTAVGDHVAVIAGSNVPFLLRDVSKVRRQAAVFEKLLPRETIEQSLLQDIVLEQLDKGFTLEKMANERVIFLHGSTFTQPSSQPTQREDGARQSSIAHLFHQNKITDANVLSQELWIRVVARHQRYRIVYDQAADIAHMELDRAIFRAAAAALSLRPPLMS